VGDETMQPVPRGDTGRDHDPRQCAVMKGYLKNSDATVEAFKGGCFHCGDSAIQHGDGYIPISDHAMDIIISGSENISSVEVEGTLMGHDAVMLAARGRETLRGDPHRLCPRNGGRVRGTEKIVFEDLQQTSTGRIQKFKLRKYAVML